MARWAGKWVSEGNLGESCPEGVPAGPSRDKARAHEVSNREKDRTFSNVACSHMLSRFTCKHAAWPPGPGNLLGSFAGRTTK
ncbi:hypothetical protein HPP92_008441, partial [Vanilla planifolia]